MIFKAAAILLLSALMACAGPVVLYSNLGPGDTWDYRAWSIGGGDLYGSAGYEVAIGFTPAVSAPLESVELALSWFLGPTAVDVSLLEDDGGVPGAVIESYLGLTMSPSPGTLLMATSTAHPLLVAGTQYWLAAMPSDPIDTLGGWNWTLPQVIGPLAWRIGDGLWTSDGVVQSAARIMGDTGDTGVPEPAAFLLAAAGLLGLATLRRRSA